MSFEVVVLGSGTSVPSPERQAPAYLVRHDETAMVLDCGSGCGTSLARVGVTMAELGGIFLTHLHLDHCGDLPSMLFSLANPLARQRSQDLWIRGPSGTAGYISALQDLYGRWVQPQQQSVRGEELEPGQVVQVGQLRIMAQLAHHSGECLCYRVEDPAGASLCFSGDSDPCEGLSLAAAGADLLLCECAALEQDQSEGHMKASQVGQLAAAAGCGQVVLTHLYPHVVASDPVSLVRQSFAGPVALAHDGMVLKVQPVSRG